MEKSNKKIVCLGGGIGTVNLIKGLQRYYENITIVVSMADDGGSAGRLRRLYGVLPVGDLVSCMAALIKDKNQKLADFLTYRFPGDRYGSDGELAGHKLGNLIMVTLQAQTNDFEKSIRQFQEMFRIPGVFLPSTLSPLSISATLKDGSVVEREEVIDLGNYDWKKGIDTLKINPSSAKANPKVIAALKEADAIIAGPGDLYTTTLPVLLLPEIKKSLQESKAKKIFIINITNKPFETNGFTTEDYIETIKKHLGFFPFQKVLNNTNHKTPIPKKYKYSYVNFANNPEGSALYVAGDFLDEAFPLYHDSKKLAKRVAELI